MNSLGAISNLDLCLAWNVLLVPERTLRKKLHVEYNSLCLGTKKYIDTTIVNPDIFKILNVM